MRAAVGTSLEAAEMTATYRNNGQVETLTDGEGIQKYGDRTFK